MGGAVNTVTGVVDSDQLGVTLVHEHVTIGAEGLLLDSRVAVNPEHLRAEGSSVLRAAKVAGIDTIVDATPIDLCRDVRLLKDVSEASGVRIVCATGLYMESHGLPAHFKHMTAERISELYVQEIETGIGTTGIRAGVIKVATSEQGITDVERKVLEAAADAQARTGVPIITHTSGGFGVEQARILVGAGATPAKIVVGHVDHKFSSLSYYLRILRTGVNLGFDRCGLQLFMPDTMRAALIAGLVDMNLQERLFLSMDSVSVHLAEHSPYEQGAPAPLRYLVQDFAALLERYGVDRSTLRSMLTANPARLFAC